MANVWQANYWAGGNRTYNSGHNGYDSSTGYCNLVGLGQMIAGRYGSTDNVTCLRFACNDGNYSKLHFKINNETDYTGSGTVKILVRTSALSSVTKTALENVGTTTREYTCANGSGKLNEFDLTYDFIKGNVYYIYIWGKNSDTWRFRWYAPNSTYTGFAVDYTEFCIFTITGDDGVEYVTGSGRYPKGASVATEAQAKDGYHLVSYTGQTANGTGSQTLTGCAGSSFHMTTWTINADRTIKVNSALNTYTLTYTNPTGATISVKRGETSLSSGSTITHGDSLTISVSPNTGYNITSIKVNDSSFTSGGTHTVSGNVTIIVTAILKTYKLTISQGTGTSITVTRNSTSLSNGATITHGDSLVVAISANTGYNLASQSHTSGATITVGGNITVSATATLKTYTLNISIGKGTTISVNRTSSPLGGASTGTLSNSATIYHNDILNITIGALSGYRLIQQSHNNGSYTVASSINVNATAELLGLVYVHNGTSWDAYEIYIDNGSVWDRYIPHIDNGSKWNICI